MNYQLLSDECIIENCLKKDESAYRELYNRYVKKLTAVCYRYADTKDEVKEILQESFIQIFENLKDFRKEGSFEGWLKKTVVRIALRKGIMKTKNINRKDDDFDLNNIPSDEDIYSIMSAKDLTDIIKKIPEDYRTVLNLYADGFSHEEIAVMLKITTDNSKTRLARARKMVIEKIENTNIDRYEKV